MNLQTAVGRVFIQLDSVIENIHPSDFTRPSGLLNQSTIGQHVRHILEFFICLMDGMPNGTVNYDNRKRDQMIEEDPYFARQVIRELQDFINAYSHNPSLQLETHFGYEDEAGQLIPSNYLRELTYNIEHAIHHMAIMRIAINEFCDYLALPADFGVASSTVRNYQRKH
jgi:uncharacterized damage-inducible protein DinB